MLWLLRGSGLVVAVLRHVLLIGVEFIRFFWFLVLQVLKLEVGVRHFRKHLGVPDGGRHAPVAQAHWGLRGKALVDADLGHRHKVGDAYHLLLVPQVLVLVTGGNKLGSQAGGALGVLGPVATVVVSSVFVIIEFIAALVLLLAVVFQLVGHWGQGHPFRDHRQRVDQVALLLQAMVKRAALLVAALAVVEPVLAGLSFVVRVHRPERRLAEARGQGLALVAELLLAVSELAILL